MAPNDEAPQNDNPISTTRKLCTKRLPRQLQALRHRNYRLFFVGQVISLTGTWVQQVAQGWLVLRLTNSALLLGLVGTVSALPILLFSLPAGVAADRFRKRNTLILTQTCAMILALALGTLVHLRIVTVYHVMAIGFLLGVVNAFDAPTRHSFVIEMVGRVDLMNAIALNSAMFNTARVIGPAIAGILIGEMGLASAFFLNGLSFLPVIACLELMRTNSFTTSPEGTVWEGLRSGLSFVRRNETVMALLLLTTVFSIFSASYMVLMPIFARDILNAGAKGLGYLMSAVGLGALTGAGLVSSLGDYRSKGKLIFAGNLLCNTAIIAFSFSVSMPVSLGLLVLAGCGMTTSLSVTNTLIQTLVPDRLRGRVMSLYILTFLGMAPLGSLQMGTAAQLLGAPMAIRAGSIICACAALALSPKYTKDPQ